MSANHINKPLFWAIEDAELIKEALKGDYKLSILFQKICDEWGNIVNGEYFTTKDEMKELQDKIDELEEEIDEKDREIEELEEKIERLEWDIDKVSEEEVDEILPDYKEKIKTLSQEVRRLYNLLDENYIRY